MNYVSLEVVQYAAEIMRAIRDAELDPNVPEEAKQKLRFVCEHQAEPGSVNIDCWNQPEYLVPDATRISAGGDIERKPMFFCREHTAEIVGEDLEHQPVFDRITPPGG